MMCNIDVIFCVVLCILLLLLVDFVRGYSLIRWWECMFINLGVMYCLCMLYFVVLDVVILFLMLEIFVINFLVRIILILFGSYLILLNKWVLCRMMVLFWLVVGFYCGLVLCLLVFGCEGKVFCVWYWVIVFWNCSSCGVLVIVLLMLDWLKKEIL